MMRRGLIASLIMLSAAVLALAACTTIENPPRVNHTQQGSNAPSTPASPAPTASAAPPANPAPPAASGFLIPSTLDQSVASEQAQALAAAPASNYDSTDDAPVSVSCQNTGTDTFTCTGSDTDGDVGSPDNVTVGADGSSWSDSGMTWSGPDVTPAGGGGYFVSPVTGWTGS
jgi:hypothetical protein